MKTYKNFKRKIEQILFFKGGPFQLVSIMIKSRLSSQNPSKDLKKTFTRQSFNTQLLLN